MDDQRRNIDPCHVRAEVFVPSWHAGQTGRSGSTGGYVPAGFDGLFADAPPKKNICVIEILEEFGEEGVTVCSDGLLNSIEHTAVHTFWVVGGLQKEWWNSSDNDSLR